MTGPRRRLADSSLGDVESLQAWAVGDVAIGWARIPLVGLASILLGFFTTPSVAVAWAICGLVLEAFVYVSSRQMARGDMSWLVLRLAVVAMLPFVWISYAVMLWQTGQDVPRMSAICIVLTTAVYVAVACHMHRTLLIVLIVPPIVALVTMLVQAYADALPLAFIPVAALFSTGIGAIVVAAAVVLHRSRLELRQTRAELRAERDSLDARVQERTVELSAAVRLAETASAAKSLFLANMSHELRTPLNAVINYAEMLEEDLADMAAQAQLEDAGRIASSGRHLLGLVNDLLEISRIEAGKQEVTMASVALPSLLGDVADVVRPAAEARGNVLDIHCDPALGWVLLDETKVRQILLNLAGNACKFTEHGAVSLSATRQGGTIRFIVRDTGIGIAPERVAALFEPFMQADSSIARRFGGTGLGLSISQRLAGLLGGKIVVSSALGEGATFVLTLPYAPAGASRKLGESRPLAKV